MGEFLQDLVEELVAGGGLRGAAGMEETGVVDDAAGWDVEGVQLVQERELIAVGVTEADELPEQGQTCCFAEIAFSTEFAGGAAVGLEDDQGGGVAPERSNTR